MLDGRGEDVPATGFQAVLHEAEQGQVVALRGPAGEDHFLRADLQHGRYLRGLLDRLFGPLTVEMGAAAGVAELLKEVGLHGLEDTGVHIGPSVLWSKYIGFAIDSLCGKNYFGYLLMFLEE